MSRMDKIEYLLLRIGGAPFAIPLNLVLSVSESAPATPVPYAPAFVRGIVVVNDRILPLISMARVLGLAEHVDGPLVIAAIGDDARALEVGSVAAMVAVEASAIDVIAEDKRSHPLLGQCIRHGGEEWLIIDYVGFIRETAVDPEGHVDDAALIPIESADHVATAEAEDVASDDHTAYLLVTIAGDTYALLTADVAEILVPGAIRFMPGAPAYVRGLFEQRNAPMLALSPTVLLGRTLRAEEDGGIAVVVEAESGLPYSLIVDHALGIARVAPEMIFALDGDMAGVSHYMVMEDGAIVGVLSPAALVAQVRDELWRLKPEGEAPAAEERTETSSPSRRLLSVRLGENYFALDLSRVDSILASVTLSDLPGDGAGFDGLADIGDRVVPVKDLRRVFASPLVDQPPCVLLQLEGALAGIAVDQVLRIEDVAESDVEPVIDAPQLPVHEVAHVRGRLMAVLTLDRLLSPMSDVSRSGGPAGP
jgi:chemotaxis signal transduction protein